MSKQVTASKTALLLECSRPFADGVETQHEEPSEAMRYGSALHEVLELSPNRKDSERIAKKWGADHAELYPHAVRTLACLKKWMAGDNIFEEVFHVIGRETHRATKLMSENPYYGEKTKTRECDFDSEAHTYDLRPGEFGGTDDLVVESHAHSLTHGVRRVVIDYKSGDYGDFHKPSEMPQMLTLALQTQADAVAILHSPREGVPVMYVDAVPSDVLEAFADKLRTAMARIGDGSLRPGPWCQRCSARIGCPAGDADLLKKANALIKVAVTSEEMGRPLDKGRFHVFLQELDRLAKRAKEVLKADVKAGEIIVRPDGQILVLNERSAESLSKASIVRALGKQKGEALIESLRKKGCVSTSTWEELRAVKE